MRELTLFALVAALLVLGCIQQPVETEIIVVAPEKPQLRAQLLECSYEDYPAEGKNRFRLFFKLWNAGETPTKTPAAVCLSIEKSLRPKCLNLNQVYRSGQVLWKEIEWADGKVGQEWNIETNTKTREDQEYKLYYTEDQSSLNPDSITLYEGSTDSCPTVTH